MNSIVEEIFKSVHQYTRNMIIEILKYRCNNIEL